MKLLPSATGKMWTWHRFAPLQRWTPMKKKFSRPSDRFVFVLLQNIFILFRFFPGSMLQYKYKTVKVNCLSYCYLSLDNSSKQVELPTTNTQIELILTKTGLQTTEMPRKCAVTWVIVWMSINKIKIDQSFLLLFFFFFFWRSWSCIGYMAEL